MPPLLPPAPLLPCCLLPLAGSGWFGAIETVTRNRSNKRPCPIHATINSRATWLGEAWRRLAPPPQPLELLLLQIMTWLAEWLTDWPGLASCPTPWGKCWQIGQARSGSGSGFNSSGCGGGGSSWLRLPHGQNCNCNCNWAGSSERSSDRAIVWPICRHF